MSRTDLNPGPCGGPWKQGLQQRGSLCVVIIGTELLPQSTVENSRWMGYPGPLSHHQPQSLAITSPDAILEGGWRGVDRMQVGVGINGKIFITDNEVAKYRIPSSKLLLYMPIKTEAPK